MLIFGIALEFAWAANFRYFLESGVSFHWAEPETSRLAARAELG
jgi:hypothetical protein